MKLHKNGKLFKVPLRNISLLFEWRGDVVTDLQHVCTMLNFVQSTPPHVGVTAIYNMTKRTKCIPESTTAILQTNENSLLHHQAMYNWFAQLLVQMSKEIPIPEDEEQSEF